MGFLKDIQTGISSYGKAVEFIFRNQLAVYFLIPLFLNIVLFWLGYSFISTLSNQAIEFIQSAWHSEKWDFWGAGFLTGTINFFIWLSLRVFFFFLFAFWGGYLILILLSPLLAYLSEKTEKIVLGTEVPFSAKQLLKDLWRGILLALRNFLMEMAATLLLFLLSFLPIIGWLSAPLLFLISAYYYGFSFLDYNLERRQMSVNQSIKYLRRRKGLAVANGSLFTLALLIPFVGVSLSGFMAIISTVAASLGILKNEGKLKQLRTS